MVNLVVIALFVLGIVFFGLGCYGVCAAKKMQVDESDIESADVSSDSEKKSVGSMGSSIALLVTGVLICIVAWCVVSGSGNVGSGSLTRIFINLRASLGTWGGIILGILGVAALIVSVVKVVKGLIKGGLNQVKWPMVAVFTVVGGLCMSMAFGTWAAWTNNPSVNSIADGAVSYDVADQGAWVTGNSSSSLKKDTDSMSTQSYSESYSEPYEDTYVDDTTMKVAVESGFVKTVDEPVSTISADVDTASWTTLKDNVTRGYAPNANTVRIEEMLNYFDYEYAVPKDTNDFAITRSVSPCPWNKDAYLLALGYAAGLPVVNSGPLNITFLVDVSGSMSSPERLRLFQAVIPEFVDMLSDEDTVSLVTYSGEERVVLDSVSGGDKDKIKSAVASLEADGSTNGEAGIKMAYEVAGHNFDKSGVNRVLMVTDGDLNVGISSPEELEALISEKAHSGIYLSIIGVGMSDYGDERLETLADSGDGMYYHMNDEADGHKILCEDIDKTMIPFADDVKSQVSFNAAEVESYRLIGYANRTLSTEDFKDDSVDAAEVGPGMQFTVLYEIIPTKEVGVADMSKVPEGVTFVDNQLADLGLRWKSVDFDGEPYEIHDALMVADVTDSPSDDWRFASAVAEFGMLLINSEYKGTSSYESIVDVLGFEPKTGDYTLGSHEEFFDTVAQAHANKLI